MAQKKQSTKTETLTIGWCDNGMVDGKFTEGLTYTMLTGLGAGIPIASAIRISGNQIARQRQNLIDAWYDEVGTDWLLWLDSDVVLTQDILDKLWKNRRDPDGNIRRLITGVYMVTQNGEQPLMQPLPDLFLETENTGTLQFVHPLPLDELIEVDSAGFGLLLMNRNVVTTLRNAHPDNILFYEDMQSEKQFVGEDIHFFRKAKAAGIKLHAHTGAIAKHMKRFPFDEQYYYAYWMLMNLQEQTNAES